MEILSINNIDDAKKAIASVDCTAEGVNIMAEKAVFRVIKIPHMQTKAANLLKQILLSKGGDVAVSRYSADLSQESTDIILMATLKQYRAAISVLMMQPWGLKQTAINLKHLLNL